VNAFILSLVPKLGTLGSNEGGVWATGSSTLSPYGMSVQSMMPYVIEMTCAFQFKLLGQPTLKSKLAELSQ